MSSNPSGNTTGSTTNLLPPRMMAPNRSSTFSTCSPTHPGRACTLATRKAIPRPTSSVASTACADSMSYTRWAGMHSACLPNSTPSIPAPTPPSPRRRTSTRSAAKSRCSDSAMIGTGKWIPPIHNILSGPSGFFSSSLKKGSPMKPRFRSGGATAARRCSRTRKSMRTVPVIGKAIRMSTAVPSGNGSSGSRNTPSASSLISIRSTGRSRSRNSNGTGSDAAKGRK